MIELPVPKKVHKSPLVIYELIVFLYEYPASGYPVEITTTHLGKFSSLEKAQAAMLASLVDAPEVPTDGDQLAHSFIIREVGIDVPAHESHYEMRAYDERGDFYSMQECDWEPFLGRAVESNRFKLRDFIEFISDNRLQIGVIVGLPLSTDEVARINRDFRMHYEINDAGEDLNTLPIIQCDQSDNTYTVLYDQKSHSHLVECQLFKPRFTIDDLTNQKLLSRLNGLNIPVGK
jgi:hypothetical protein